MFQNHSDLASLQAQSTGEDSNSSDTAASDQGDGQMDINGSMDMDHHSRTPTFGASFLGLPGLLPGTSGMHGGDNFGEFTIYYFLLMSFSSYDFYFILKVISEKRVHLTFSKRSNKISDISYKSNLRLFAQLIIFYIKILNVS